MEDPVRDPPYMITMTAARNIPEFWLIVKDGPYMGIQRQVCTTEEHTHYPLESPIHRPIEA